MYFGFSSTKYGDIAPLKTFKIGEMENLAAFVTKSSLLFVLFFFFLLRSDPRQKKHSLLNERYVCCFSLILSSLYLFM